MSSDRQETALSRTADRRAQLEASVLVGSVTGGAPIHHLLEALDRQVGDVHFEVVVADRCTDGTAERIERERSQVAVLRAEPSATLPELRTLALERSRGRFVLVTEDHTVPPPDWVTRLVTALSGADARIAAVGGPVDNAMCERAVDWAAFLCEYGRYLPPQPAGETHDIPGMNIAYRREHLEDSGRTALTTGFWESTVHPRLLGSGHLFLRLPEVVILHRKRFSLFFFLGQRFHYSRYFAGIRFPAVARGRRLLYALLSAALPALVLTRIARGVWRRPPYHKPFFRALPPLLLIAVAWAAGEFVGYLLGPGHSLEKIE